MRGISEEILKFKLERIQQAQSEFEDIPQWLDVQESLLYQLLSKCKELNQWKPIDENTPKDRDLILLFENIGAIQGKWSEFCQLHIPNKYTYFKNKPTHWMELPQDPELPEPPK